MDSTQASFLKEMGITQWVPRESGSVSDAPNPSLTQTEEAQPDQAPRFFWWFIGSQVQGDSQLLLQNIVRTLGLGSQEWRWIKPSEDLGTVMNLKPELTSVAIVFGESATHKITGEREPLLQLRQTVLGINQDGLEEIPVVATVDLGYLISKPKDKLLLWQDLLLAKSVLQSL